MEKKKISKDWRYVLIKVVDRIDDRDLTPTLLSFVEQVFPKGYAKEEVLEKLQNRTLRWEESIQRNFLDQNSNKILILMS